MDSAINLDHEKNVHNGLPVTATDQFVTPKIERSECRDRKKALKVHLIPELETVPWTIHVFLVNTPFKFILFSRSFSIYLFSILGENFSQLSSDSTDAKRN